MRTRRPVLGRDGDGGLGEHRIGEDRSADAPDRLEGKVGRSVLPFEPAEAGIDEGDDRVEVAPRDRAEHQDDGEEPRRCRRCILEELEPDVARGEVLRGDARADDDGGQEGAAQELGEQAPPQDGVPH